MTEWLKKLLDPALGANLRATLRVLTTLPFVGAYIAGVDVDVVLAWVAAAQGVLALLVVLPTPKPAAERSPFVEG